VSDIRSRLLIPAVLGLVVAACSAAPAGAPSGSVGSQPASEAPASSSPGAATSSPGVATPPASDAPAASPSTAVELTQAWAVAPLTDVATGERFRIADLAGSVVIVEPMAIWCSNCRAQQGDVQAALALLPPDRVVYVVLDVVPNEDAASLAAYQAANGFAGRYAIAGEDVARALAADFGDQFLNPPNTPMLIIGTDGTVTQTEYGHKGVDELVALAEAHGA
jgi:thiol-disulfide isomerase/thioredoxin